MHGIGLALFPLPREIESLRELAAQMETPQQALSFSIHKRLDAMPHLSLMQGVFENDGVAMEALADLNLESASPTLKVCDVSIWATKIVFLNFERTNLIQELHNQIADRWLAICKKQSADPQAFNGITDGQHKSFSETGYPFSYEEFIPHVTLAHLASPVPNGERPDQMPPLPVSLTFEKLALFRVEPLGICTKTFAEWPLNQPS
ncbi:MAG: 2'-5' RNA ligase family protein [Candidatus Obscuribacterales bacterium]|nr:2'-5' RNA ligase family protein [Candidatus Obscuribacterales bacterium]